MNRVTQAREEKGLSMYALAKRARIPRSVLFKIEKQQVKSPTIPTMKKIARALDKDIIELFF